jgi:site-specific DNA-methyltransferase (adenine-specific)
MDEALTKALKVAIGNAELWQGDCLDVLRTLPDCSVDSIVTDPPYGLKFMGKRWDYDVPSVEVWAECLRVLKPGAHLLAFAGTRTQHRMAVRIEDAGFEIRDMIAWVYGSGFPKSLDVSKAIDKAAGAERETKRVRYSPQQLNCKDGQNERPWMKAAAEAGFHELPGDEPATDAARQWAGWGTALKPALEPITVARKPLSGTVAATVLEHGTGALNVDGCRVGTETAGWNGLGETPRNVYMGGWSADGIARPTIGRWPANLIHDGSDEVVGVFPQTTSGALSPYTENHENRSSYGMAREKTFRQEANSGSAARFFYCAKASKPDRDEGLEGFSQTKLNMSGGRKVNTSKGGDGIRENRPRANNHPTVKPTDLMRYLCRLVTPPGGVVLDPFMGSGSTGKAAMLESFGFIGIEREAEYVEIAKARIARAQAQGQLLSPEEPRECVQEGLL